MPSTSIPLLRTPSIGALSGPCGRRRLAIVVGTVWPPPPRHRGAASPPPPPPPRPAAPLVGPSADSQHATVADKHKPRMPCGKCRGGRRRRLRRIISQRISRGPLLRPRDRVRRLGHRPDARPPALEKLELPAPVLRGSVARLLFCVCCGTWYGNLIHTHGATHQ